MWAEAEKPGLEGTAGIVGAKARERVPSYCSQVAGGMAPSPSLTLPLHLSIPRTSPVEVACREFYLQDSVFCAKGAGRAMSSVEAELTIPLLRSFQARKGCECGSAEENMATVSGQGHEFNPQH